MPSEPGECEANLEAIWAYSGGVIVRVMAE
jgi:hypothetical protein